MIEEMDIPKATAKAESLVDNIEKVFIGKRAVIVDAVSALLAGGHILLEDVPGVGKTILAKSIARSISGEFKRIQFTADLLPSDITGVNIFRQERGSFEFRPGPLFSNVLLGDEINRATPRTQSSLLEAMEEKQATVDGTRYPLSRPFFVIATQNPIELEGTYPLPFAQMDRFIVRLRIGYLTALEERQMLEAQMEVTPIDSLTPVIHCDELLQLQQEVRRIKVDTDLMDYVVSVIRATRKSDVLQHGASPRGTLDLLRFSQARALMHGRDYVLPDDIKESAPVILAHRVIVKRGTRYASLNCNELICELLQTVEVPV